MNNEFKLLWINPSFLDYRIPLYKCINEKLNCNFRLIYSKSRVPQRCIEKIEKAIGENALNQFEDKIISVGSVDGFANKGVNIPITHGLYKLIKKTSPDIIIAEGFFQFTPLALLYALFNHIPMMIAYERTKHTERNCPFYRRWYRRLVNIFVSGYIVNGKETKEYLISQGVNPNVIFTGAMCADSDELSNKVSALTEEDIICYKKELINKPGDGLTYIYVGRIIELKGINYLLNSWRIHVSKYPLDKLLIVGDGPLLEEYCRVYPDSSIIFTGGIDYSDIYKYYAISDVFIIPTLEDNWSLVVPEAMACGLPIACSIYNGCHPELIIEDVNGKTFDPINQDSILETLNYFHQHDIKMMGNNSKNIEKQYSPEKTAENIINAVNNIYMREQ